MPSPRRRRMLAFKINEISGVDNPAQEGARVLIMKRAEPVVPGANPEKTEKAGGDIVGAVTGITDGHQHGLRLYIHDSEASIHVMYAQADGEEGHGHDHAIIKDDSGNYAISMNAGHTHTLDSNALSGALLGILTKFRTGGNPMSEKTEPTAEEKLAKAEEQTAKAEEQAKRLNAVIALAPDLRKHFDTLDESARTSFLAKDEKAQKGEIEAVRKAAEESDPVVYTNSDGLEVRKSHGPVSLALAKSHDSMRKENAELKRQREDSDLAKRAETELAHLPGDVGVRAALLKAVGSIEDKDQREAALAALKAQNENLSKSFVELGHRRAPAAGSPDDGLDKLAREYATAHKVSYEKAYSAVLNTPEGGELYQKTLN